jgi:hypothetical protein
MRGFWIAIGLLAVVTFGCTASFIAGQTGLVVPLFAVFYFASLAAAYNAGRSVDLQMPFRPRHQQPMMQQPRSSARPAAAANGRIQRLQKERDDEFA